MTGQAIALLLTVLATQVPSLGEPVPVVAPAESTLSLQRQLLSRDPDVRSKAAWALAGASDAGQDVIDDLERLLHDPSRDVRYGASWALGHLATSTEYYDQPPVLTKNVKPLYPRPARKNKVQGTVVVMILIGEDGEVAHAELRASIRELDDAALDCVRQWEFEPARREDRPVATIASAPVTFRIE